MQPLVRISSAGVEVIFGVFGAQGKLPVNVNRFDEESASYTEEIVYPNGYGITYASRMVDSGLGKVIAQAEALNEDDYTAESFAAVEKALADAKAVEADKAASQAQKDAALTALIKAIGGLEYGTQKLHLEACHRSSRKHPGARGKLRWRV